MTGNDKLPSPGHGLGCGAGTRPELLTQGRDACAEKATLCSTTGQSEGSGRGRGVTLSPPEPSGFKIACVALFSENKECCGYKKQSKRPVDCLIYAIRIFEAWICYFRKTYGRFEKKTQVVWLQFFFIMWTKKSFCTEEAKILTFKVVILVNTSVCYLLKFHW